MRRRPTALDRRVGESKLLAVDTVQQRQEPLKTRFIAALG